MSEHPSRRTVLGAAAVAVISAPIVAACADEATPLPPSGTVIAPLDAVPDGESVVVTTAKGAPVVLRRDGDSVTALSGVCTHQGCSLRKEVDYLLCPCHNSKFDWDGSVISGLADEPLPPLRVTIEDGNIIAAG